MTPPDPTGRPADDHAATDRAAAQEAAVAYWRSIARERRVAAAQVQRRPLVRAAIAVDRRTARAQAALTAGRRAAGAAARAAALRAAAGPRRATARDRQTDLARQLDLDLAVPTAPSARALILHLGPRPGVPADLATEVLALDATDTGWAAAADRAVAAADVDVVALLGPGTRPLHEGWLSILSAAVAEGPVVAAAPLVLHPERPWSSATPHDGRTRSLGLDITVDGDGRPLARAADAGGEPDRAAAARDVHGATGAAVVVRRDAWLAAGGLVGAGDGPTSPHLAVVDLGRRLRTGGGTIRTVPAAVVEDASPVRSRAELLGPVADDDPDWLRVVELGGPALVRGPTRRAATTVAPPSITITTAVPSRKIAPRSGDWLYAGLYADALRRAGHPVRVQTADHADDPGGRIADVHLVLRGLEPVRRTPGQVHVLWVISHPEALELGECDDADLVLVASHRFAAHLRTLTTTPVEVLLQATEPRRFHPRPVDPTHHHAVTVVANARGVHRAAVADAVAAGLRPAVYGAGWGPHLDPSSIAAEYAPADLLPTVYASADLVLNDHWDTMRHWGFVSNRIFDVLASGTTVVSDELPELAELFGDRVPTWTDAGDLRRVLDDLRADPAGTARRTAEARALVLAAHTFDHRAAELVVALRAHGLVP